ncbi:unnamed protein product [Larinioides sclopetarius]|uniref:MATH domain-containing protein n=1 Tax=Larinioides sclopetarius TaxID=280406 RepID=A0AAV2AI95_9ARAC
MNMGCLTVNSIRKYIGLQWNLKVKDFLPELLQDTTSENSDSLLEIPEKTIGKIQCRIKSLDNLIFSLELTSELNLFVKGHRSWSYEIIYAFAVVKDRAFLVKYYDKIQFLLNLKLSHLDSAEEVTFHCMILVGPPLVDLNPAEADLGNDEAIEGPVCVKVEEIEHPLCKFDGEIPDFTIDNATELIANESTNSVLKILAMEYLMKNTEADNVSNILKIAVDEDLKSLMKHCSEFLSECIIRRSRKSSTGSSTASSN